MNSSESGSFRIVIPINKRLRLESNLLMYKGNDIFHWIKSIELFKELHASLGIPGIAVM